MEIYNISNVPESYKRKDYLGIEQIFLGKAAGSERVYVNIDHVKPNNFSSKYHSHSAQEEFFIILSGSGVLRMNNNEVPVKKGDFVAKPAGDGNAHQFYNTGEDILEIMDIGTVETEDICFYPDEDIFLVKSHGESFVFRKEDNVIDWDTDPNTSGFKF
jgi:uncharacterized cupin superfamily protein